MKINVTDQSTIVVLEKQYQWKFPNLSWRDPAQVLLGIMLAYHSRYDQEHYRKCDPCYSDHLDLLADCEADARD